MRRQKPFYLEKKHLLLLRRKAGQQRQHFKIALIGNGGRGFFLPCGQGFDRNTKIVSYALQVGIAGDCPVPPARDN